MSDATEKNTPERPKPPGGAIFIDDPLYSIIKEHAEDQDRTMRAQFNWELRNDKYADELKPEEPPSK